jgi:hypothetical protein
MRTSEEMSPVAQQWSTIIRSKELPPNTIKKQDEVLAAGGCDGVLSQMDAWL